MPECWERLTVKLSRPWSRRLDTNATEFSESPGARRGLDSADSDNITHPLLAACQRAKMARKRGAQAHGGSIERHSLVFSRKTNAFRAGNASLPPPPAADSEVALPRKLREAMALKAGRNLLQERREREQQRPPPRDAGAQPSSAAGDRAQKPRTQQALGVAAGEGVAKRKPAYLSPKARRKRARREKAAAEAAEAADAAPRDAPRFMEVAEAPPAMALARKHTLGALFEKQLQAAKSAAKSRVTAAERDSYIAAYRKLRGHEAIPFLANQARSLM